MTQNHIAAARLTMAREPLIFPALEQAMAQMTPRTADKRLLASIVARPLGAALGMLGLEVVRRDGVDVLRYMLRRGVIAGGADMGNYLENEVMEHVFKNTAIFTSPTGVFIALFTAATNDVNDSGTEASGGSYAREEVLAAGWDAVSDGATANTAAIDFGTATASWGTITHTAVESTTSGAANRYFHGALTASKAVGDGDSFQFAAGEYDAALA